MIIPSSKGFLGIVTIYDSKLMITYSEVYLLEKTSSLKLVKQVINPRDRILTPLLMYFNRLSSTYFYMNNTGAPHGKILGLMKPLFRRSFNCSFKSL